MSRYHNIHCRIWNDDKFPFTSDDCQLCFFHLLTTPISTQFGLFKTSIPALAAEKRWPEKRYLKAFQEALEKGFVKHNEKHQIIWIPRFLKYNKPNNPNVLISWGKAFNELPECELKLEFYQYFEVYLKDFSESFQEAFQKAFIKPSGKVLVSVTASVKEGVQGEQQVKNNKPLSPKDPGYIFQVPTWIDHDVWDRYVEMRKKKKCAPTEYAKYLVVVELEKLKIQGHDPIAVLQQSIKKNWQDVYPIKNNTPIPGTQQSSQDELLTAIKNQKNTKMPSSLSQAAEAEFHKLNMRWTDLQQLVAEGKDIPYAN